MSNSKLSRSNSGKSVRSGICKKLPAHSGAANKHKGAAHKRALDGARSTFNIMQSNAILWSCDQGKTVNFRPFLLVIGMVISLVVLNVESTHTSCFVTQIVADTGHKVLL